MILHVDDREAVVEICSDDGYELGDTSNSNEDGMESKTFPHRPLGSDSVEVAMSMHIGEN